MNEMIVKASMDTGAYYGVRKCAEIVFRKGKMVKGEVLAVLEEKMDAFDPNKNEIYKFLGCEQADKTDVCYGKIKLSYGKSKEGNKKETGPSNRTGLE